MTLKKSKNQNSKIWGKKHTKKFKQGKSMSLKSIYKWGGTPVVLQSDNYRLLPGVCLCVLRLSPSSSSPLFSSVTTGWLAILPQWGNWTSLAPNPPWQPQPSTSAISAKPTTQWAKNGRKRPKNTSLLGEKWVNPLPLLPWLYGSGAMTPLLAIIWNSDMTCLYNVSSKPKTKIHFSVEPLMLGCIVRFVC